MSIEGDATRRKVREYLKSKLISFDYMGGTVVKDSTDDGDKWRHYSYTVEFRRESCNGIPANSITSPWRQGIGIKTPPDSASVLHSLTLDMVEDGYSFEDWARDFGYDTDSRKAEKTYQACLEQTKKVKSFFTASEIEELKELLQDY